MFSPLESHVDEQVVCWSCEEVIHESVIVCPYCSVETKRHPVQKAADAKITRINATPPTLTRTPEKPATSSDALCLLGTLLFLLTGSTLLFVATLISFFSRDGVFTISWPEHSWSAFFGLGIALVSFGTLLWQRLHDDRG